MKILTAIRREDRKLEKKVGKLQRQLEGVKAAAKVLGNSASSEQSKAQKRVLSAAARANHTALSAAKISAAAKRRWPKVRAGAKKAVS